MQPHKHVKSALVSALSVGLLVSAMPSCAFKRFDSQDQLEATAASAESLEEALAILDRAIEETAPASEINSIHLDIPIHPDGLEHEELNFVTTDEGFDTIFEIEVPPEAESAVDFGQPLGEEALAEVAPEDTIFVVESEPETTAPSEFVESSVAIDAALEPPFEAETIPGATPDAEPRQRLIVNRPAPDYSHDSFTTDAIDEFRTVRTTAYSHTEADHIQYGELSAMGKPLRFGMVRSAAADWSRYPVGTRFRIVGKPYEYVIDDYGSALVGTNTIDLYKPSGNRMDNWGAREVSIEVIAWGSFGKSLEILEPRKEFGDHIEKMITAINEQPGDGPSADAIASIQPNE